ncbi:MAG: rhomboid family intramembrane serine protease [Syntrophus sp. (in: bacteria)]|nr:rhomboid family intramembrane serine protease [Syntrophus sp. (in: bacteria)]
MIPIKGTIPKRAFPIITTSIIFVNMLLFLWQKLFLRGAEEELLCKQFGLIPRELLSIASQWNLMPHNVLTIFTSMFLHEGALHLIGNMLYLWIFGGNVEDTMGRKRFLFFYLLSGIAAALFQLSYDPSSDIPMIGASGAVSGILGAYLVLFPLARVKTILIIIVLIKIVEVPAVLLLTIWFLMQIFFSYSAGVAWYAHIGGFIFGLIFVKIFTLKKRRK